MNLEQIYSKILAAQSVLVTLDQSAVLEGKYEVNGEVLWDEGNARAVLRIARELLEESSEAIDALSKAGGSSWPW